MEVILDNVERESRFLVNSKANLAMMRGWSLPIDSVLESVDRTHSLIGKFKDFDVDVFSLLGMRNLSAFMGEVFAAQMVQVNNGLFRKNPHQDGYPDLLLMDRMGEDSWAQLSGRLREKGPFSPFPTGGLEVGPYAGAMRAKRSGEARPWGSANRLSYRL